MKIVPPGRLAATAAHPAAPSAGRKWFGQGIEDRFPIQMAARGGARFSAAIRGETAMRSSIRLPDPQFVLRPPTSHFSTG